MIFSSLFPVSYTHLTAASAHRRSRDHLGAFGSSTRYKHAVRIKSAAASERFRSAENTTSRLSMLFKKSAPMLSLRLVDHALNLLNFLPAERAPLCKRREKRRKRAPECFVNQILSLRAVKALAGKFRLDDSAVIEK